MKGAKMKTLTSTVGKARAYCQEETGYTLPALLIFLTALSLMATIAQTRATYVKRSELEKELLFRGQSYIQAIERYYHAKEDDKRYPPNLEALLLDPRFGERKKYLRRLYKDPITNEDWRLIYASTGGIMGVVSKNTKTALKTANFPLSLSTFKGKQTYAEWRFEYTPPPEPIKRRKK